MVVDLVTDKLGISINMSQIDRSHRIKSSRQGNPLIVKFISHNTKNLVYQNKNKKLKGTRITITEALTSE